MNLRLRKGRKKNTDPTRKKSTRRGARYWASLFALSSLMASAPYAGSKAMTFTHLRETRGGWEAVSVQEQAQQAQRFNISAGPLEAVLEAFQRQTSLRVIVPIDAIRSIGSPGVNGTYTPEAALQQILTDTGVAYTFTAKETVTLEISGIAASVDIIGRATISSPKYTEPLRDVPQTITVIPKTVIEEQGATTLRDVLRNVPGLTMTAGEGGVAAGDNLTLRGFSARNDVFVDGVRDLGPQSRDPYNLEQVEVAKGPSSAFNGRGSAGGTINLVSKSPGLGRFFGGGLNFGSDRTKRFTGDLNLPLKALGLGERAAFRLNALWHESGVAGRDVVENNRWGVAPSLAFGVGGPTRLTLSYFKNKQDNLPDYGIPWVTATHNVLAAYRDKPAPVARASFYGLRARDFERLNSDLATVKFEQDFQDNLNFRTQFRYGRSTRNSITSAPRFASNDNLVINRNGPSWLTEDNIWDSQTDFRAHFSTGRLAHAVVVGAALTRENNKRQNRTVAGAPTTTLYDPNPEQPFTGTITLNPIIGDVTGDSQALYVIDTVKVGRKLEFTGNLRWDRFDVDGFNQTGVALTRVDRMTSWRAGAVYKPRPNGSLYASYGTSLNPSLEGLSYNNANTSIAPEKTYTYELGTKWDVFREQLSLSGAFFQVEKTNARTPGVLPDDPVQVLQGNQRVRGVELGAAGNITRSWRVFGAYTFMDSEITRSNTPAEVGKEFQNTPRNSFSIWSTYSTPWRLSLGGGPRFVGKRYGNNTNTRFVEKYWTLDAMASYPLTEQIDLRLNVYNLNNAYYFDRLGGGHLIPGAARSVNVSTNFRF